VGAKKRNEKIPKREKKRPCLKKPFGNQVASKSVGKGGETNIRGGKERDLPIEGKERF